MKSAPGCALEFSLFGPRFLQPLNTMWGGGRTRHGLRAQRYDKGN